MDEDLDTSKLTKKIAEVEEGYKTSFKDLMQLFKKASKLASLFEHNQFDLSPKVLDHVISIKVENKKKS